MNIKHLSNSKIIKNFFVGFAAFSFIVGGFFVFNRIALATDTGAKYPGTVSTASEGIYDDNGWNKAGDVAANDGKNAYITEESFDQNDYSNILKATNFGFNIPDGSTINGIKVEIERNHQNGDAKDAVVQLTKTGTRIGDNKADTVNNWPASATAKTYGEETDLWGTTWTRAEINASTFGVHLAAQATNNNADIYVDYIRITVYYALPAPRTINASAGTGGIIDPSGSVSVDYGTNKTFTITPNSGYIVSDVLVDSGSQGRLNSYTFTSVVTDHAIDTNFEDGWKEPSTYMNSPADHDPDGNNFSNPTYAYSSNEQYATSDSMNEFQRYGFTNFPIIPDGAIINGIAVAVEAHDSGTGSPHRTFNVSLSWNGGTSFTTGSGTGVKNTGDFGTSDTTRIVGSSSNLWGTAHTWSDDNFTDANFKIKLQTTSADGPGHPISLDQLQVKVYYTSAPTLTVTKIITNNNGGAKVVTDFPLFIDGNPVASGEKNILSVGAHVVSETGDSGYSAVIGGDCDAQGNITLIMGDIKNCTITNDDIAPQLIIIKHIINDNGGTAVAGDFALDSGGINDTPDNFAGAEAPGTTVTLDAGAYNVTESGPSGYAASLSADCSGSIALGQSKTCTITNDDIQPKLTVTKIVVNDVGGTKQVSDFPLSVGQTQVTSGVQNSFNAGIYTVSETGQTSGYATTFSGNCDSQGNITLNVGDVKSCTITNSAIASLTVTKVMTNNNGGISTASDFSIHVKLDGNEVAGSPQPGSETGTVYILDSGAYAVSEDPVSGYAGTFSGDCSSDGFVTINPGEVKSCTITNDDIQPKLTVTKVVNNNYGGTLEVEDFPLFVGTTQVTSGVQNGFNADTYTISETSQTGYVATISGDCDIQTGSINLQLGDVKSCTITNDDIQPKLTVTKIVINDNGGTKVVADFPLFVGTTQVTSGQENGFNAGNYIVSETPQIGYIAAISGDCDTQGNITLQAGDIKSCTITNDDIAQTGGEQGGNNNGGGGGGETPYSLESPDAQRVDANRDGKVDILDFNILMVHWGETGGGIGDFNGDGKVDILDFDLLMLYWMI